jgi:hypothetical protein
LNIGLLSKTIKIDSIIVSKDTTKFSQEFVNIYIKSIIEKNFNIITKGKMKQIDEELLCNIEVEYPTIEFQKIFLSHYKFTIDAIELNNNNLVFFVAGVASRPINFNRMNINEWIHVAWVLSSVDNKWKIYKNGVLINSVIANYPEVVTRNQNYIGKLNNNLFFDGSITYFKMYNLT